MCKLELSCDLVRGRDQALVSTGGKGRGEAGRESGKACSKEPGKAGREPGKAGSGEQG